MDNSTDQIRVFLSMFAVNAPTFLVCAGACVVIVLRWQQGATYPLWALFGFGLALVLCFVVPLAQTALQQWVFQSGDRISRAWVFSAFAVVASLLHAVIYVCLFVAIFAGRTAAKGHETGGV
jgi:hypothetical protein